MSELEQQTTPESENGESRSRWNLWVGSLLLAGAAALTVYLAAANAEAPDGRSAKSSDPHVRAALQECGSKAGPEALGCYQEALSRRLRADGVAAAMEMLEELYPRDDDVERDAHVYAHHIGIEAYALSASVAETFAGCSDMYSSGCYHGVIQAYFEDEGAVDSASVNGLCEPYKGGGQSRWILFQCLHGMGHGLTMHHDHHLVRALEACDLLTENWDRRSCYGGAFMENVMAATAPHHPATMLAGAEGSGEETGPEADHLHTERADHGEPGSGGGSTAEGAESARDPSGLYAPGSSFKALDRDDPHYPCSAVEARYVHSCYHMQTSAMLHLNGGDIGEAAESCTGAPEVWRTTCFQSLGRDITAYAQQDPDGVIDDCEKAEEGVYRGACYYGAVKALVDWRSAAEPGLAFCNKVEGEDYKTTCYRALGEEIATLVAGADERAALCRESEESYVPVCRQGARLPVERETGDGAS